MRQTQLHALLAGTASALFLAACGGGGGGDNGSTTPLPTPIPAPTSVSTGTVTAFGSVFVNGHEFKTGKAKVVDDDTDQSSTDLTQLEVGMSVDVKPTAASTDASPEAGEIHLHPLVRGYVDGSNAAAGTLTVMGQTVQLSASTNFSDHRACVTATTLPCTAVAGQADLTATTGSGSGATAGSYVTVHGYLYTSPAGANSVVATLVSVNDLAATPGPVAFKAEGVVGSTGASSVTIGGLAVSLSGAVCKAKGATVDCATAFATGNTVSTFAAAAPSLPATAFTATGARLRSKLVVETDGAAIELEGKVTSVDTAKSSFVLRGVTVDASALTSGSLPAAGDIVEVAGTVVTGGAGIKASTVKLEHSALAKTYLFEGDASGVAAGTAANTWTFSLLGQTITVDARTHLNDRTIKGNDHAANPFNITTFQTYLAASASKHLQVKASADANGALTAQVLEIVAPANVVSLAGVVDATPAPATGSPSTFSVHGIAVSADPASIYAVAGEHDSHGFGDSRPGAVTTVKAGDLILVRGALSSGTITVTAPVNGGVKANRNNGVLDFGVPTAGEDHGSL